jgi:predicted HTH domain antitoxin
MLMQLQLKPEFEEILEPLGENAAVFFLAASLYYAHKVSFAAAAALANLSFNEFLYRLQEHFGVGFQVADESVLEDLQTVADLTVG